MKRLTIIRHGKSSWTSPTEDDFARPLNSRGVRDCERMPGLISNSIPCPDLLLSSDAVRAKMTAEVIAEHYQIALEDVQYNNGLYLASLETILECLDIQDDVQGHIMLVGHNPGLTELYKYLCPDSADDLPTFAVVDLKIDVATWGELDPQKTTREHFLKPKLFG